MKFTCYYVNDTLDTRRLRLAPNLNFDDRFDCKFFGRFFKVFFLESFDIISTYFCKNTKTLAGNL